MTTDSIRSATFSKLQPVCVKLLKDYSLENLTSLRNCFRTIDGDTLSVFQEYVTFPLCLILKCNSQKEKLTIATLDCLEDLFSRSEVISWSMFSDLYLQLLFCVSSPKDGITVIPVSEEVKISVVKCLTSLVKNSNSSVLSKLYEDEFRLCLGHSVSVILSLSEKEQNRLLKTLSMKCLMVLSCYHVNICSDVRYHAGNAFAGFLPGIVIALSRTITGDEKQGQNVVATSLQTWTHVVVLVLGDESLQKYYSENQLESKINSKDSEKPENKIPKVVRSKEWVLQTAEKMLILVTKVQSVLINSGLKVKLALLQWAGQLLFSCCQSLENCISPLFEVILALSMDEHLEISDKSQQVIRQFSEHLDGGSYSLVERLEEDVYNLTLKLSRIFKTGTDNEKITALKQLSGYFSVLQENMNKLFMSWSHCEQLMQALLLLVEMDSSNLKVLMERPFPVHSVDLEDHKSNLGWPHKVFKNFSDQKVCKELIHVCRVTGYFCDAMLLIDFLKQKILDSSKYRQQALLLLNEIILGCAGISLNFGADQKPKEMYSIIQSLLYDFLSPEMWEVPTLPEVLIEDFSLTVTKTAPSVNLEKANNSVLQVCLLLETVANFSAVLKQNFKPLLLKALFPLLEKAGTPNYLISQVACISLHHVARNCGYDNVKHLIKDNIDYLVNTLTLKLRHFQYNQSSILVLQAVLNNSSMDILIVLEDVIYDTLNALDFYHNENGLSLLKVLESLVTAVNCWCPRKFSLKEATSEKNNEQLSPKEFVLNIHEQKCICNSYEAEVSHEDNNVEPDSNENISESMNSEESLQDNKPETPLHVKLILEVLRRCIHLQSGKDIFMQTLVLKIIGDGVLALSAYENDILPMIHLLWSPLVCRFSKGEPSLCIKAFSVLETLAKVAGDFIRKRTLNDVWPGISQFLIKQHQISSGKASAYKFTSAYKYQLTLLEGLGNLAQKLDIDEVEAAVLASAVLPYIQAGQPQALQESASKCLKSLASFRTDCIWFCLMSFYSNEEIVPSSPLLRTVKFTGSGYSKLTEVSQLIDFILSLT